MKCIREALCFDDVLIVPKYSKINSRKEIDTSVTLFEDTRFKLDIPVLSAGMDTITNNAMANAMACAGGLGVLHRKGRPPVMGYYGITIGLNFAEVSRILEDYDTSRFFFSLDIAHAHQEQVKLFIRKYMKEAYMIPLMVGNVATRDAALMLSDEGIKVIKVGIGGGSSCSTRIATGVGIPTLDSIIEINELREGFLDIDGACIKPKFQIVADGGIRFPGDVAKSIIAGADAVMIGGMLAGTQETPGDIIEIEGMKYKRFRGMASADAKADNGYTIEHIEGESFLVPYTQKSCKDVLTKIKNGLQSSMSYVGAKNLKEFRNGSYFVKVTMNGRLESLPHMQNNKLAM